MTQTYSCPHCQGLMQSFIKDDLEYEACTNCHGLWFDFGELKAALSWHDNTNFTSEIIVKGDDESDHAHDYHCIKCHSQLEEREYAYDSGIHIDGCNECKGIFVSAEDLKLINQFLHSSKHSDEAQEAHFKAQMAINKLEQDYRAKQANLAQAIDGLFKLDDLKPINAITEWLIGELVDVDSFHIANRK